MATGQGPEYSAHFYNQGLAAIQAGFHDDGKKTLQMAVRVDPGNELAKKALASLGSATPLRVNKQGEL
jgi:Tfp pilus assembly protein PilF